MTAIDIPDELPQAWSDLFEGLAIFARHPGDVRPFNCAHDELTVCADPAEFTAEELQRLGELGFRADSSEDCFRSYRFGSAC